MLQAIPLLVIAIVGYFLLALLAPAALAGNLLAMTLPSGALWTLRTADMLAALGLLLLYIEIFKATRSGVASVLDHGLSLALFVACLVMFLVLPAAGTGTFFLLMIMSLLDVVAGFTVTIATSRRDVGVSSGE